jgi:hypothetical protein
MKKYLLFLLLLSNLLSNAAKAALPFVTDDAGIAKPNQLVVESFIERWTLPASTQANRGASRLYGPYLSFSYGLNKHLEFSAASMASYNVIDHSTSFLNPILQLKTKIFESENKAIPAFSIDWGYVNKNGSGEYFDPATNYYAIGTTTSHLFDDNLIIHANFGKKASYDIEPGGHVIRTHLGVALDMAMLRKDFRLIVESFNGAPNSPRDSPSYFRSHQVGLRWIKAEDKVFYVVYGEQPTFTDYGDNGQKIYSSTNWVQVGMRLTFDDVFSFRKH